MSKRFGFELQSWIALDVLPALQDAECPVGVTPITAPTF
jgi:hypothetical protein